MTRCPCCSLLASAACQCYKPICIRESPFYHKLLTVESGVILRPEGSNKPSSCLTKVIRPCYCFQARLTFPLRIPAVWMHLADLHVLAPVLQVALILAGVSHEVKLHLVTVPLLLPAVGLSAYRKFSNYDIQLTLPRKLD